MSVPIRKVAQMAEDIYYGDYKSATDFFDIEDFVANCAYSIGTIIDQAYKTLYAQNRAEKKDEVIGFDASWTNIQVVTIERKDGEQFAKLEKPIMTFLHDNQTSGIQNVFCIEPKPVFELERVTLSQAWQVRYWPRTNRIAFIGGKDKLDIINKGDCNAKKLRVHYIPAVGEDMDVPDGIVDPAITATVAKIRSLDQEIVSKKSLDGNINRVMQTEIDKSQLK